MRLFQIAALAALAGVALVRADDEHGENAVELKEKGFEVRYHTMAQPYQGFW